jgi:hypothetical protein
MMNGKRKKEEEEEKQTENESSLLGQRGNPAVFPVFIPN